MITIPATTCQYSSFGNFLTSFAISRHVSNSVQVGSKSIMVRTQLDRSAMLNFVRRDQMKRKWDGQNGICHDSSSDCLTPTSL
jgi:hypothetical protein